MIVNRVQMKEKTKAAIQAAHQQDGGARAREGGREGGRKKGIT